MNALNQTLNKAQQQEAETQAATTAATEKAATTFLPKSDIVERETSYHLFLEIPGVKKENVELQLEKQTLRITGKLESTERGTAARREYREGNYERSFTLSEGIDSTDISANLEDGLLEVTLPKKPDAEPVKISVS